MRPLLVALVLCGAPLCGATRPIAERSAVLPQKVNLAQSFSKIEEPWSPHIIGQVNECALKLAIMKGEFVWHHHELEDECFYVVQGRMRMMFRDPDGSVHNVDFHEGELVVVPRGTEHCPAALTESCHVLLVERSETVNTGSAADELGDHVHEQGSVPLTKRTLKRLD